MEEVPRERFVPEAHSRRAYHDGALPIGYGQTISQPWVVAAICEALEVKGPERVLEVGTGSGYSACILSKLAAGVITIERIRQLAETARELLAELSAGNVEVLVGDGSEGLPERGPYDAIAVHATSPAPPRSLIRQLAPQGRLVIPIATDYADMLTAFRRTDDVVDAETLEGLERRSIGPCRFVPLIGTEGFSQ